MTQRFRNSSLGQAAAGVLPAMVMSTAVQAINLYVDDDATLGGDGLQWSTAFRNLQDALQLALHDPTLANVYEIHVAQGTYYADLTEHWPEINGSDHRYTRFSISRPNLRVRGGYAGPGTPDPEARDLVNNLYPSILSLPI